MVSTGSRRRERDRSEVRLGRKDGRVVLSAWNPHNPVPEDSDVRKRARTGLGLVRTIVEDQYGGVFTLVPDRDGTLAHNRVLRDGIVRVPCREHHPAVLSAETNL